MADYIDSKPGMGEVWPINAVEDSWGHLEPLLSPDMLKARHLFGIPLVSYMKDPITQQRQVMTDPILKDLIDRAVGIVELELRLDIMPRQYNKKFPFDRQAYASLGYMMLPDHPIQSLDFLGVVASDGNTLYHVPPTWVETAYLHTGQINIIPMTIAFQYGGFFVPSNSPNGGSAFLAILGQNPWLPAYWGVKYTTGFPEGRLPQMVNELIGVCAAIEALGLLATTNARNSSHSIGVDGLSQSISTPGPQIYDTRIALLTDQKDRLTRKLRVMYGTSLFTGAL
jgi:hypothetical protein